VTALERWRLRCHLQPAGYVARHMADTVTVAADSAHAAVTLIETEIETERERWGCAGNCRTCESSRLALRWLREEIEKGDE
jgi:hypothetical protein